MHILFISHSGGRTGAPYLLLDLLRWLQANTEHTFQILLKYDGPLREDFARIAKTSSLDELVPPGTDPAAALGPHYRNVDLIYSNTGTNGRIVAALAHLHRPVITHLHEMRYALAMWGENAFDHVLALTTQWICASRPVLDNLCTVQGVDSTRPVIIPDFIQPAPPGKSFTDDRFAILKSLGLSDPVRLILGVGTFDWRKGADLFLQVAGQTLRHNPSPHLHFVWIGDEGLDDVSRLRAEIEIQGMGIADRLHLCGFQENIRACIAQSELFLLPSREDPCPLVALEASALGKPILCFQGAGGIADLAQRGAGVAVDFMDVGAMSTQILRLLADPAAQRKMGELGAGLVRTEYSLDRNAHAIEALIRDTVNRFVRAPGTASDSVAHAPILEQTGPTPPAPDTPCEHLSFSRNLWNALRRLAAS